MRDTRANEVRVWTAVLAAAAIAFTLGISNLGEPSLWHDETVHVFVARNIVETGTPQHNTGVPYYSGTTFHYILAFVIRFWGWGEAAVRTPSVVAASLNVILAFAVVRSLLGTPAALVTAFAMALCPWTVAWSREARFYSLQQAFYLCTAGASWQAMKAARASRAALWGAAAAVSCLLGVLTAFHSGLFLSGIGVYAAFMLLVVPAERRRWFAVCCAVGGVGLLTIGIYVGLLNPYDRYMVYGQGGVGGEFVEDARMDRFFYITWLRQNLSTGVLLTALLGFALMLMRERRRGLYACLAFWLPVLMLTFVIGYRRDRFMFFAFPFYLAAAAYAAITVARWLTSPKPAFWQRVAMVAVALLAIRVLMSAIFLIGDSVQVASGSNMTLAKYHEQWREPCRYVRERLEPDEVVLTTTFLPTLYYVGRADNWYPTRALWGEVDEAGMDDLKGLPELQKYVSEHPKGYFLSDWWRFERNPDMQDERRWVAQHMRAHREHSSPAITVYSWGIEPES